MTWRERVRRTLAPLSAYDVPPLAGAIKLDANESPFPLSRAALEAMVAALGRVELHRYPDASAGRLRQVLGAHLGVPGEQLVLGNGSDELIGLLCATFAEPRTASERARLLYPAPGFVVFRTAALAHGVEPVEVPLGARFEPDEAALLAAVERQRPNLILLATPNNPTGTVWPRATVEKLVARHPDVITVVDEAYHAYGDQPSCRDLALAHPHLLVLGTLSKIGLAALRIGFLVGRREVLAEVEKLRPPYNLDSLCQEAAAMMLEQHRGELEAHVAGVRRERQRLGEALAALPGVEVFPSGANFFLVRLEQATAVHRALRDRGVLVRSFDRPGPLAGCLRITIGTPAENDRLLAAWRESLPG